MTALRCIAAPISFLALERFALGELESSRRTLVEQHLEACAACRAALASINDDARALPPLVLESAPAVAPSKVVENTQQTNVRSIDSAKRGSKNSVARWAGSAGAVIALAAGVFLFVRAGSKGDGMDRPSYGEKGGSVVLSIVDEGGLETSTFEDHQRVQLLLTCPQRLDNMTWNVSVIEDGVVSHPVPVRTGVACGNRLPFGTLALSGGEPIEICVSASGNGSTEEDMKASGEDAGEWRSCLELRPKP